MSQEGVFYPQLVVVPGGNTAGALTTISTGTLSLVGGNNITLSQNGQVLSIVGGAGAGGYEAGNTNAGNTAGDTGVVTGRLVLVGSDNITLSGSTNGGSMTLSLFGGAGGAGFIAGDTNQGNTAGDTGVVTGRLVLVGSNNITLSGSTNGGSLTLTISGPATHAVQTGISGVVVSDVTYTSGTVSFSNQNNITIGSSVNGATQYIRLSVGNYITTARASTDAIGLNTAQTNVTWTVNSSGLSLNAGGYAGTGFTSTTTAGTEVKATNNTAGLSMAVPAFLTAAGGVQTAISGIIVSDATYTSGTVSFSNQANITIGSSVNGATQYIRLSGNAAQTNVAFSADASSTFQTLTLQDSNGISFSNNGGAVRLTHALQFTSATSAITSNALNTSASRVMNIVAATNNTGGGTASLSSNVSFSAANGLTFYTSAGNAVVASYTVPTQSNQQMTMFATGNTTLSSTGTTNASSIIFRGTNAVSVGISNGSVVIDAPNAAAGNVTFSASANSSGLASVIFANSNNITFGLTTGSQITASFGGGGGVGGGVSTDGNTSGSTGTVTTGNIIFVGTNALTLIQSTGAAGSAATITFSVPQTSSLVGTNGISVSTNGSTISVYPNLMSEYAADPLTGYATNSSLGQNTLYFQPFDVPWPVSGSRLNLFIRLSGATSTGTASTCGGVLAMGYALYTRGTGASSERLSRLTSYSLNVISHTVTNGSSYGVTHYNGLSNATSHSTSTFSAQSSSGWTNYVLNSLYGQRVVAFPLNSTMTPGRYWLAVANSTTTANINNLNFSVSMLHTSFGLVADIRPFGTSSAATNASVLRAAQGWGTYSATSNAFPDSIALSTDNIRAGVAQTLNLFNISGIGTATNLL